MSEWSRIVAGGGLLTPTTPLPFRMSDIGQWGLRDYQYNLVADALDYMAMGFRRVLLQLPTGGGKTRIAGAIHGSSAARNLTSEFLVHRKELVDQTSDSFSDLGIAHSFIASGKKYPCDLEAAVIISGVQTLVRRLAGILPPNLVILDEAHHATAASWQRVLEHYGDAFILGLTATPERLDGKGLTEHFDVMVRGPSVAELVALGHLSDFDYYAPGEPDVKGVHTTAGDFNRGEIGNLMDRPKLIGDMVAHYRRLAEGQPGIIFAASRDHSRNIVDAFNAAGFSAAHVDGESKDRDDVVERFRKGRLDIMSNVDLFGEGFDVPGVVYCGLARPTKSLSLHLQQVGRALRTFDGKPNAVICDHAGNAFRHGLPDDDREWSLEGREARERASNRPVDAMPVRQCKSCFRVSPSTVATCPGCGEDFPVQVRQLAQEEGTLNKLERQAKKEEQRRERKREERACNSFRDLAELGERRGYHPRWARIQWNIRKGAR